MYSGISTISSPASREMLLIDFVASAGPRFLSPYGVKASSERIVGIEIVDTSEFWSDVDSRLLIAPSLASLDSPDLAEFFDAAKRGNASAVALKFPEERVAEIEGYSIHAQIPVFRVTDQLPWRLLDAHLAQVLGESTSEYRAPATGQETLFALANELAEFFGGSVAIEDLGRNILAYSSVPGQVIDPLRTDGILLRQVPDSPFNDDQYRTVLRADGPVKFPRYGAEEPRVAIGIRGGTVPLGTIWAIDRRDGPDVSTEQAHRIGKAAELAGSYLLNNMHAHTITQRPREERLRSLLSGVELSGTEFAELGFSEEAGVVLLAFELPDAGPIVLAQLRATVFRHLSPHRPDVVAVVHRGRVYAVLATGTVVSAASLTEPLLPLLDRLVGGDSRVAITGPAFGGGTIAEIRSIADDLLAVPDGPRQFPRIRTVAALRPALLVARTRELFAAQPELQSPELTQLASSERSREVAVTLLTWLETQGNTAQTAQALGIHENTVRHRLKKITDSTGISLGHPDDRWAAWTQLRVALTNAPAPSRVAR